MDATNFIILVLAVAMVFFSCRNEIQINHLDEKIEKLRKEQSR